MSTSTSLNSGPADLRRIPLVQTVATTLRRRALCAPGMSVMVAVSGGPDSVALLHALHRLAPNWRLSLSVVHCNYGLRKQESHDDEAFVRTLCRHLRVPCFIRRLSVAADPASTAGGSLQERARELRYRAFHQLAARRGIDRVALGHTADDQAETVLLWMLRGAGATGLSGMPWIRDGLFIRPLLDVTRSEVLRFLATQSAQYRTDSSNHGTVYLRNRLRQQLMPTLQTLNPGIVRTLARQADVLAAEADYLQREGEAALNRVARRTPRGDLQLDRTLLAALPLALQRRVVREAVRAVHGSSKAPSFSTVTTILERVLHGRPGVTLFLRNAVVSSEYEQIVLRANPSGLRTTDFPHPAARAGPVTLRPRAFTTLSWRPTGQTVRMRLVPVSRHLPRSAPANTARLILDADRVTPSIHLRSWQPGDWFCPSGMGGHRKKLQDYWTDAKIPRAVRARTPVMVAPEGILWVVGHRADHRFLPGPTTARLLIAEVTTPGTTSVAKER